MPEKELHKQVSTFAHKDAVPAGMACYHTWNSMRSDPGFPDWVFCVGDRTYYVELKGYQPSRKKHYMPEPKQVLWLNQLAQNPNNHVYCCYAWDWSWIMQDMFTHWFKFKRAANNVLHQLETR